MYRNKYRISSIRLRNWDYGWNGSYFITLCTRQGEHFLGEISDNKMILSEIGELAEKYWYEIPIHFPFVKLDVFVVMPNHVHGILIINKTNTECGTGDAPDAETQDPASLLQNPHPSSSKNKFGPQSKNLASIVRGYKIGVTRNVRKINPAFAWQARFYDHIIRDEDSFRRIKYYILKNPGNWGKGRNYK